jgi:hypothetical protein
MNTYNATYKKNEIFHTVLIKSDYSAQHVSEIISNMWFDKEIIAVKEARPCDMKPGISTITIAPPQLIIETAAASR